MLPLSTMLVIVVTAAAPGPMTPVEQPDCLGEVLELSLGNILTAGGIGQQLARERCIATPRLLSPSNATYARHVALGRMTIVRFHVAGAPISLALNLTLASAPTGYHDLAGPPGLRPLDELYLTPELRLPEAWEWALQDYVATPVLIGASTAVGAAVLWSLLHP
ncbi:MAG: hypothetical protein AAB426_02670 [Myxococcota bacterium]